MARGDMDPAGEGMTRAGKVLGIIATVLMGVGLLVATVVIGLVIANIRAF